MKNGMAGTEPGGLRLKYGFWVVIAGLAVVAAVFVTATLRWSAASDVTTAVSSVTGVVGTIVGAFFGMQLGSAGGKRPKRRANGRRAWRRGSRRRCHPRWPSGWLERTRPDAANPPDGGHGSGRQPDELSARSNSSSRRFLHNPPPYPRSAPSDPTTRWQGTTMASGLSPLARPTAR